MSFEVPGWNLPQLAVPGKRQSKKVADSNNLNDSKLNPLIKKNRKKKPKVNDYVGSQNLNTPTKGLRTSKLVQVRVDLGDAKEGKTKDEIKLAGARFRSLNQRLYEIPSYEAAEYFQTDPKEFYHYHVGFREQTKAWPVNPVDLFISKMKNLREERSLSENRSPPHGLPGSLASTVCKSAPEADKNYSSSGKQSKLIIVDMGCGEARIASELLKGDDNLFDVKSFDLVAANEHVTVASMTDIPISDGYVDIVVFSLSLMNTDYGLALREAYRILKPGSGRLWIAEVSSRFDGKLLDDFRLSLHGTGFKIESVDRQNTHFFVMEARKIGKIAADNKFPSLKACLYKKR